MRKINNNQDTQEDWVEFCELARASINKSIENLEIVR